MTFNGQEYKKERKEAQMTQEDVQIKTGIYATHVSRYETGKQIPTKRNQERLWRAIK